MNKIRYFARRRDLIFAGGYLVLAVLAANGYGWYGANLGLGISMGLLTLLTAIYLWPSRKNVSLYSAVCIAGALACCVSFAWSGDAFVKTLAILLSLTLSTCAVVQMQGLWQRGKGSFRIIGDLTWWAIGYPLSRCGDALYAVFHKQAADGTVENRKTGSVLVGLACALPLLVVLVPLLMSSDAAFAGLLERVDLGTVIEMVLSLLLGAVVFLLLFSQSFMMPRYLPQPSGEKLPRRGIEPLGLGAFLAVICALYVLYLISQLAYFFSGFAGILPEGFTAAEYARRGFFEMTAVCAINFLLIFLCLLTVRKKQGREPLGILLMCLFICLFSLVLIATALSKMALYIGSYGMTRLRILTSVFMLVLAVSYLCVILRLFIRRFGYMQPILAAAAAALIALSFVNCDRLIAQYNYDAWQAGELEDLDVDHLGHLGDAVVPVLWEIAQSEDPDLSQKARGWLTNRGLSMLEIRWPEGGYLDVMQMAPTATAPPADLRAYNRDTARAIAILSENWDTLYINEYWNYIAY